jgi:flagellin
MRLSALGGLSSFRIQETWATSQKNLKAIATGKPETMNPASQAVSRLLATQAVSVEQANSNVDYGQAALQVAEGAYLAVSENLSRMRELAVQASSELLSENERSFLKSEFNNLMSDIESIATSTNFDGTLLLNGSFDVLVQVGADASDAVALSLGSTRVSDLGLSDASLNLASEASASLEKIDSAMESINSQLSVLGASNARLEAAEQSNLSNLSQLIERSESLSSVDMVGELARLNELKVKLASQLELARIKAQLDQNLVSSLIKSSTSE